MAMDQWPSADYRNSDSTAREITSREMLYKCSPNGFLHKRCKSTVNLARLTGLVRSRFSDDKSIESQREIGKGSTMNKMRTKCVDEVRSECKRERERERAYGSNTQLLSAPEYFDLILIFSSSVRRATETKFDARRIAISSYLIRQYRSIVVIMISLTCERWDGSMNAYDFNFNYTKHASIH